MAHRLAPILVLVLTLCSSPALAGAWPREAGRWFLATTSVVSHATGWRPSGTEVYAEYGWQPRLTLVSTLVWSSGYDRLDLGLRWHPPDLQQDLRWALMTGLRHAPRTAAPIQGHLGVELGRGMALGSGNLWVDFGLHLRGGQTALGFEVEVGTLARVGLQRGGWIGMLGVTHDRNRFAGQTRLRPALGYGLGNLTLVAEGEVTPSGAVQALRLSLWSEF